jgi:signal transduction histidine kinase
MTQGDLAPDDLARSDTATGRPSQLQRLLRANQMIVTDLELPVVLRRIVEAACELVGAPYGALGVISPTGSLEQFVHVGMDAETVSRIGRLPEGKGLLGALIEDSNPIRVQCMADDPRSVGLPARHPPMTSFLGVPIRVCGEVYGNLYLTGHDESYFSAEDEQLASSLAASAGVAIQNARLFTESQARLDWLRASTEITRQLLSDVGEEPLRVIARRLQQIADADAVNVVLPTADGRRLMVEVATGAGAADITAVTYPIEHSVSQRVLESGLPVLIGDIAQGDQGTVHLSDIAPIGPIMVLPLVGAARIRGALIVARLQGGKQFSAGDLDMATTFANHAALALELSDARADQARVVLLEDHDRIARDLHDHVIQRLFGAGLIIQSVSAVLESPSEISRLSDVIDDLDDTIRQIRMSIFQLRGPLGPAAASVRAQLLAVVAELAPHLGFQPRVSVSGPLDALVDAAIVPDLLAVLREGLTNAARHAGASWMSVEVIAESHGLSIEITDDGVGIGDSGRRSGLANLAERAENYGGHLKLQSPTILADQRGTSLKWTIPLLK